MSDLVARLQRGLPQRYTIVRELGRGGMATVFLAEEAQPRRQVAIKVLDADLGLQLARERFFPGSGTRLRPRSSAYRPDIRRR